MEREDELRGRAYGFIECYAPEADLQLSLAKALVAVTVPDGPQSLQLKLTRGVNPDTFRDDPRLHEIASEARECGRIGYVIKARSEMNNHETAMGLADVIGHSVQSNPDWYSRDGMTSSRIVYRQADQYFDIE